MARLLLGVTGGIAAYKALETARLAVLAGHAVRVIQTPTSERFIGRSSFEAITGAAVLVDDSDLDPACGAFPGQRAPEHQPISHLELVRNAQAFLIAPASANTLAKLAHGLADNLLTNAALAARCPLVVAPAMNDAMYEHPATQDNLALLARRGVTVLEPGVGELASRGERGIGRLPEPEALLVAWEAAARAAHGGVEGADDRHGPGGALQPAGGQRPGGGALDGMRLLISAGGTREPIDAVRFVGNRSSGRMGFALASEAARRGAQVTVVAANVTLARDPAVQYVDVSSAAELQAACEQRFADCDVLIMAAAVADYRPHSPASGKIKKQAATLSLELERTTDVLATLAARRDAQTIVGFAAEHGADALANARAKLGAKGLDAVVVNDIARNDIGFDADSNEVTIITAGGETHVPRAPKPHVAAAVLDAIVALRGAAHAPAA